MIGESTLYASNPSNVFILIFKYDYGSVGTEVICLIPLLYIVFSTGTSLFELKLQGKYGLYKNNHTQPSSLIYCSYFMARLIPVLSYNFLLLLDVKNTEFLKVMNVLNIIPYFGDNYSKYFPLFIAVFCSLNIFNVYNKLMKSIGLSQFTFAEVLDPTKKSQGKAIIAKARIIRERIARQDSYTKIKDKTFSLLAEYEEKSIGLIDSLKISYK